MKKLSFFILLLLCANAHARIFIVKEFGVNSTYSTISSALSDAADYDTIVVYDKPSGQPWTEDLTIDKSIWILHPVQGTRFKVPGLVTIVPKAGMDLHIIGWDFSSFFGNRRITVSANGATATPENRAKITVADCIEFESIYLGLDNIEARIFYNKSEILRGAPGIIFKHGLCVGNSLTFTGIQVLKEESNVAENDSILILGNVADFCRIDTKEAVLIANNYFDCNFNYLKNDWITSDPIASSGGPLHIAGHNQSPNVISGIYNNTLKGTNTGLVFNRAGNLSNIKIVNNIIQTITTSQADVSALFSHTGNTGKPFISFNFIGPNGSNISTADFNYFNTSSSELGVIDAWGRAATSNTALVNKGNYLGEYSDIDLSRNDLGTSGGPYSINNYLTTGSGKSRVLHISIPHQLININEKINIKASGGFKL